jgi:peptidoglycan/LPS O-acetylase OafA/YrhL
VNRLPSLDLLRAIAIVWVMLFHSWIVGGLGDPYDAVAGYGWMGVDLFFVLSGYLIGYQLLKPLSEGHAWRWGDFLRRRAFRILPAFLVVLAIYAMFPAWREAPGMQPVWQFLTFTVNLLIDYQHNQAFSHAWSLCVEEHFYLVFPLMAWVLTRHPSRTVTISVAVAVIVIGMLLRGDAWTHGKDFLESIYYPTYTRLDGLLAGVLVAAIHAYRPSLWHTLQRRSNTVAISGLLALAIALWLFRERTFAAVVFGYPLLAFAFGCLVAAAASTRSPGRWRIPGAGWIAGISYSLYLSHKLALHAVSTALAAHPGVPGVLAFFLYAAAVLAVGAGLHYAVERPCIRLGIGHRKAQRASVDAAHAASG